MQKRWGRDLTRCSPRAQKAAGSGAASVRPVQNGTLLQYRFRFNTYLVKATISLRSFSTRMSFSACPSHANALIDQWNTSSFGYLMWIALGSWVIYASYLQKLDVISLTYVSHMERLCKCKPPLHCTCKRTGLQKEIVGKQYQFWSE